jgi:hypothetical protein
MDILERKYKIIAVINFFANLFLLYITILAISLINTFSDSAIFDLVLLDSPDALCLDGTHGAYYISR